MAAPTPPNPPQGPGLKSHHTTSTPDASCKYPLSSQENITQSRHAKKRSSTGGSSLGKGRREAGSA